MREKAIHIMLRVTLGAKNNYRKNMVFASHNRISSNIWLFVLKVDIYPMTIQPEITTRAPRLRSSVPARSRAGVLLPIREWKSMIQLMNLPLLPGLSRKFN